MNKRRKLTKEQEALKQRILSAYRKPHGFSYMPPNWNAKLWKKSTADICEFLEGRFRETLDVVEYYSAMVLLWKTLPNSELLVEFHQSPQWAEVAKTYQAFDDIMALNRSEECLTETKHIEANRIKTVVPIQFIGDHNK